MPHALTDLPVATVTRPAGSAATHEVTADVCLVGADIAGLSAAIESARLGRSVVLVDVLPVLGGQMVNSLIGLFCGVFGNAPGPTDGVGQQLASTPAGCPGRRPGGAGCG